MGEFVRITIDGASVQVPIGTTVAAAMLAHSKGHARVSLSGEERGPLCGMGICYECRAAVDDVPSVRTCRVLCRDGMKVRTLR